MEHAKRVRKGSHFPDDALWRAVFESLRDTTIIVLDRDGVHIDVRADPGMEAKCGMKGSDLIGISIRDAIPGAGQQLADRVREVFESGIEVETAPYLFPHPTLTLWHSVRLVPIKDDSGRSVGVLGFIRDLTYQTDTEIDLRLALQHLADIRDEERRSIARDLHDSLGQQLFALRLLLKSGDAQGATEQCEELMSQIRGIAKGLHPASLSEFGLAEALQELTHLIGSGNGVSVNLHAPEDFPRLPNLLEINLYRIVQESVTNALKHGAPKTIEVTLRHVMPDIELVVIDDGHGFDATNRPEHGLGILLMRERANAQGGTCVVTSSPKGTTVTVKIPFVHGDKRDS